MSDADLNDFDESRRPDFPEQTADLDHGWVCVGELGTGVSGNTWAVLKRNQHDMIIDRMAVKDSKTNLNSASWREDGIPFEVIAMDRLRGSDQSTSIVRVRDWRLIEPGLKYRLYMELCPFGALDNLISRHKHIKDYFAPEPFIWCMFEDLAIAGLLMEQGDIDDMPVEVEGWELIVHRDVKLANVFLGLNESNYWRGYPTVKLGDFGNCQVIDPDEDQPSNKFLLRFYHHQSPEERSDQILGADAPGFENPQRLSSRTNVWAVGDVMWSMLQRRDGDTDLRYWKGERPMPHAKWNKHVEKSYSPELQKLILDCLEYRPQDRPSFDEILRRIRAPSSGKDSAYHLREAPIDHPDFVGKHGLLLSHQMYRLGFTVEEEDSYGEPTHWHDDEDFYPNIPKNRAHEVEEAVDEELSGPVGEPGANLPAQRSRRPSSSLSSAKVDQSTESGAMDMSADNSVQFVGEFVDLTSSARQGREVIDLTSPAAPPGTGGGSKRRRSAQLSAEHNLPMRPRQRRREES